MWLRSVASPVLYARPHAHLGYSEVMSAVAPRVAVKALREVLKGGFDPATDPHRQEAALPYGEMHLLPSAVDGAVGVKVLGIQPASSTIDVPFAQGSYLLMGGEMFTPEVVMDASALTEIRMPTAAVAGVLDRLRESSEPLECAVVGQARRGGRMRARLRTRRRGAGGVGDVCVEKKAVGSAAPVG